MGEKVGDEKPEPVMLVRERRGRLFFGKRMFFKTEVAMSRRILVYV